MTKNLRLTVNQEKHYLLLFRCCQPFVIIFDEKFSARFRLIVNSPRPRRRTKYKGPKEKSILSSQKKINQRLISNRKEKKRELGTRNSFLKCCSRHRRTEGFATKVDHASPLKLFLVECLGVFEVGNVGVFRNALETVFILVRKKRVQARALVLVTGWAAVFCAAFRLLFLVLR